MATEWFCIRDGKKRGPFSSQQLVAMAKSGQLLPTDLLWKQGMAAGKPAGDVQQLFPGTTKPSAPTPPLPTTSPANKDAAVPNAPSLKATARTAAQATQLAAERTKLSTVNLPSAYLHLGKHCYTTRTFASDFPAEFSKLDQLAQSLVAQEVDSGAAPPTTFAERAKALAGKGVDFAKKQKAALDQAIAFKRLGQAAFEKHGDTAGPSEIVAGIRAALDRITAIDQQLAGCKASLHASGMPKRKLVLGSVAAAALLLVGVVGYGLLSGGGDGGKRPSQASKSSRRTGAKGPGIPVPEIPDVSGMVGAAEDARATPQQVPQTASVSSPVETATPADSQGIGPKTENPRDVAASTVPTSPPSWNPPAVSIEKEWELHTPGKQGFYCGNAVAFSPTTKLAAVGLRNGALALIDLERQAYDLTESAVGWEKVNLETESHYGPTCISFAPSGKFVAWLILHDRVHTTWSYAIADTRSREIVFRTSSQHSRFPVSDETQKPRWQRFGGATLQMIDDQTLVFATGAGVMSVSASGQRQELNGCLPLTTSSRPSLSEQEFRALKTPKGQWIDDDVRKALGESPRQGVPHPYDASDTTAALKDYYSCHAVALSTDGKSCAVLYTGPVTPEMFKAGRERDAATILAVYEVGGPLIYQQEMSYGKPQAVNAGRRPDPMSRQHPDALLLQEDHSVIARHLGHVRRYQSKQPEELLFVGDNPTSVFVHPSKPLAFMTNMSAEAKVFGLRHPEAMRGEGLLCSLSFKPPDVGSEDGFGAVTRDFTTAVVGCHSTIQCLRINVRTSRGENQ